MRVAEACGIIAVMTEDRTNLRWAKLASSIRAAREALGLTQATLAERAGISEGSVQNIEGGAPRTRIPPSLAKIEPHLGWSSGSGRAILDGGEPRILDCEPADLSDTSAEVDKLRRKLPLRIVDELESDDPLLDSTVIQLPGSNGARMTVVVHGKPDATPSEIQEALLAWRKAERKLHRLPGESGGDDEPRTAHGS